MDDQEDTGALGSTYQGSGRETARTLAYGEGGGSNAFQGALSALMDPVRSRDTEDKAFWAGAAGPHNAPGQGASNGLAAQVSVRDAQDKLRAAYIPMIMQSMTQQRGNELAYAQFAQSRAEKVTPLINSALYGMQANGKTPDLAAAHKRIDDIGDMFKMSQSETLPHHLALQEAAGPDGSKLGDYLQQLRVAASPAAEGIPKFGTNAAGQTTLQNPISGAVGMPGTSDAASAEHGINPAKTSVEMDKMYRGDPGKYTEDLTGTLNSYNDMLNRGNSINESLASFTPGKYSGKVGGLAAATKDLARMFPNSTTESINNYVTSLMGPRGDGAGSNPVASQQFAESLKTQEALAQLKTSLDGQGRVGQQEFRSVKDSMTGSPSDPAAFNKFMTYVKGRASNVTNKLKAWGDYSKGAGDKLSVPAFEIPWSVNEATQLIGGRSGQVDTPPGTRSQPVPNNQIPSATSVNVAPPASGPAAQPPEPKQQVRLEDYEPGAKVGPTGAVYVLDKGTIRRAKHRGASGKITE